MSNPAPAPINIACPCGTKLKVPVAAIGKKGKCPKCGEVFVITAPPPKKPAAPPEADTYAIADDDPFLEELAKLEKSAPKVSEPKAPVATTTCPRCAGVMPVTAKLCTSCGYNSETGRVVKGANAKASKVGALAKKTGRLMTGVMLSAAGALLGAGIWFGVTIATDYELALIAWLVGLLAGYGMVIGYGKASPRAGVVASLNAVGGILIAKLAIVGYIIYAISSASSSSPVLQRAAIAAEMAEDELSNRGIYEQADRDREWDAVFARKMEEVDQMPDSVIHQKHEELRLEFARDNAFSSETGRDTWKIAYHETQKRVEREALRPGDDRREVINKEEFARAADLSAEELQRAVQAKDAWDADGRWADEDFVRTHLIYRDASAGYEKDAPDGDDVQARGKQEEVWTQAVASARERVEPLSHADRVAALRKMDEESEASALRFQLVEHFVDRRALKAGIEAQEYDYSALYAEEEKRVEALSEDEVKEGLVKVRAWDDGESWNDAEYVRDRLVAQMIAEASDARCHAVQERDPEAECDVSPAQWETMRDDAVAQADRVPPAERRKALEESEARVSRRWEETWARRSAQDAEEAGSAVVGFFAAFAASLLTPFNLLCGLFAVGSAYKLGSGSQSD